MIKSAGLLLLHDKKMLLCHPSSAPWTGRHDIPKGNVNIDEPILDAAIRETYEEIGLLVDKSSIDPTEHIIDYTKKGIVFKRVFYFVVRLENIDDLVISKENPVIPKDKFKPNNEGLIEVDWAGFLDYKSAKDKIFWRFEEMLEYIK